MTRLKYKARPLVTDVTFSLSQDTKGKPIRKPHAAVANSAGLD
jgi:hypothetical protein